MDRELDISRCWAVHSSSKRLFDPRDTDQAIGPFLIGKLARDGVEVPTSVFYGEYLSRPTNMTTTPAPEQMTSPFRDRSALHHLRNSQAYKGPAGGTGTGTVTLSGKPQTEQSN
jgi:hypothetical protein